MVKVLSLSLSLLLLFNNHRAQGTAYFCQEQSADNDVDWYIIYKMMKVTGKDTAGSTTFADGHGFLYLNSASLNGWTKSAVGINDNDQMLQRTLKAYYADAKNAEVLRIFYKKIKVPYCETASSQGTIMASEEASMWLTYSTPDFPATDAYAWPLGEATDNAQMIMCLSIDPKTTLPQIVETMIYESPFVYLHNLPTAYNEEPYLSLVNGAGPLPTQYKQTEITTKGLVEGQAMSLNYLSKKAGSKIDVTRQLLVPIYRSTLAVWTNTTTKNDCNAPFKTINIISGMRVTQGGDIYDIDRAKDNSKWLVSTNLQKPVWCFTEMSETRITLAGVSFLCTTNAQLYRIFNSMETMAKKEECPK